MVAVVAVVAVVVSALVEVAAGACAFILERHVIDHKQGLEISVIIPDFTLRQ